MHEGLWQSCGKLNAFSEACIGLWPDVVMHVLLTPFASRTFNVCNFYNYCNIRGKEIEASILVVHVCKLLS